MKCGGSNSATSSNQRPFDGSSLTIAEVMRDTGDSRGDTHLREKGLSGPAVPAAGEEGGLERQQVRLVPAHLERPDEL